MSRRAYLWRLHWGRPDCHPSSDRSRLYYRETDARAAAKKLTQAGYIVRLARADQGVSFTVVVDGRGGASAQSEHGQSGAC